MSCAGSGVATATNIPPQEVIGYQIWRGTTQNFASERRQGVMVLDFDTRRSRSRSRRARQ